MPKVGLIFKFQNRGLETSVSFLYIFFRFKKFIHFRGNYFMYFLFCMCPAMGWASDRKKNPKMKRRSVEYWLSKSIAP